jgi:hypothetical protein
VRSGTNPCNSGRCGQRETIRECSLRSGQTTPTASSGAGRNPAISGSQVREGAALACQLAERLQVVSHAVSLGKTKSLLFYFPTEDILRSSFHLKREEARSYRNWAADGVFRFSVRLEDPDDIIADLAPALLAMLLALHRAPHEAPHELVPVWSGLKATLHAPMYSLRAGTL